VAVGIGIFIAFALFVTSDFLAMNLMNLEKLSVDTVKFSISLIGVVIALRFIEVIYRGALIGLQEQIIYNGISSLMATLRSCGSVLALIYVEPSLEVFFIAQLISSIATIIFFHIATYKLLPNSSHVPCFSWGTFLSVKGFLVGSIGFNILNILLTQSDKIILIKLLPLSEYGYYALAATVAGALNILIGPIIQALYPKMCELHSAGNEKEFCRIYHNSAQMVTVLFGSAAIVLIMCAELILNIWTHDPILSQKIAPLLSILAIGNLLNGLLWIPFQAQLAVGWTGLLIRSNIIAVLFIIPMVVWITPHYGPLGAAWVWVFLNVGYLLITIHLMHKNLLHCEKWRWYFKDCATPLFFGFLMTFCIGALFKLTPLSNINQFAELGFITFAAFFSTAYTSDLCRNFLRQNFKSFFKNYLKN
jgi:O-antigen/teichoic acid export membrane protein